MKFIYKHFNLLQNIYNKNKLIILIAVDGYKDGIVITVIGAVELQYWILEQM